MKNAREIKAVERVIKILDSPKKWIKKQNARNKWGWYTDPKGDDATCWCLQGAILKALDEQKLTNRKWKNSYHKIIHAICKVTNLKYDIGHQDEHMWYNDAAETTYDMVIKTLKKAKAYLKGEPHE